MKDQTARAFTKHGEPRCQAMVRKGDTWHSYREQCPNRAHTEGSDYCARHDPNVQANKAERAKEAKRKALEMDRKEPAAATLNAWLAERGITGAYSPPVYVSDFDGRVGITTEALEALAELVRDTAQRTVGPVEFEEDEDYAG